MLPTILSLFSWFNAGTFFHQAHHFVLQRLTSICAFLVFYTEAPDNSHIHYAKLADHVVHDALHDGEGAHYAPRCLPETRTKVQEEIIAWIDGILEGVPSSKKMLWLTGPAGAGKTAIAGTIADRLKEGGFHVATFFFSLSAACPDRQSTAKVASTLAYQLVSQYEVIKQSVLAAIERDPAIFDKRFDAQFKAMIIGPFCDAVSSGRLDLETSPSILLIDGVDECTAAPDPECTPSEMRRRTEATHKEIFTVLLSAIEDWDLPSAYPGQPAGASDPPPPLYQV
ncbi:hypothetical protein NMY22_g14284 [Coprinellus aureogranulatus]|nr:hypothetical protein NMY22_g14284 [Coprinellus aureogranulatus]